MTRLVDVEGRRQGVMTVREQVAAFLRTQTTLCLCDECLGRALSIHAASAHRAAVQLSNSGDFQRACQCCSRCAKGRLTTVVSLRLCRLTAAYGYLVNPVDPERLRRLVGEAEN